MGFGVEEGAAPKMAALKNAREAADKAPAKGGSISWIPPLVSSSMRVLGIGVVGRRRTIV